MKFKRATKLILALSFLTTTSIAKETIVVPDSLIKEVENGNAEAAYFIATKFLENDEEINLNKGQEWMAKAAEMEYPQAMYELGEILESKDQEIEALDWFLKAIEYGHAEALGTVAMYHYNGSAGLEKDSDKDCKTSYDFFTKAVLKDDELALNNYSWFLATSANHLCRNPERALKTFSQLKKKYSYKTESMPLHYQDTEAAVLASIADFDEAIEIQNKLVEIIKESGQETGSYEERLKVFQSRKPWIENAE